MPSAESATCQPHTPSEAPRLGLHDACWTRLVLTIMRWTPMWLITALTYPVTLLIYLVAVPQREALRENLTALLPREEGSRSGAGFRVLLQFALTYLDRLWHLHFGKEVTWDIQGKAEFERLRAEPGGAIVFTVHSGNYDIGASLFARRFGRVIHTVRMPEMTAGLQELREAELREQEKKEPLLRIHYNAPGSILGMELMKILAAGEVVCVQGDRVLGDVAPTHAEIAGLRYEIPRGPLVLAEVSGAPCYPVFLKRLGRLHYGIEIGDAFQPRGQRPKAAQLAPKWAAIMHHFLQRHWDQWFVFEPLVTRVEA
jgi:phosphatidylinositol dimannoside acyltransferase